MSITVKEIRRRSHLAGPNPTRVREYVAWGSDDGDAVEDAVLLGTGATVGSDQAPTTIGSLVLAQYDAKSREGDSEVWDCAVSYVKAKKRTPLALGDEEVSFDIGESSEHITQSLATTNSYAATGAAPDFDGAIGVNNGWIDGCEKKVEQFSFSVTKIFSLASVDNTYIAALRAAAFKTNNATFRGLAAGTCMFEGASGSPRNEDEYSITFRFSCAVAKTGLTAGAVTGIAKGAYEHLWIYYQDTEDATAKVLTPRPFAAYAERIYDSADFSTLGIATS